MSPSSIFELPYETARRFHDKQRPSDHRDDYERDYARIVHSGAFRSLQGKSQIHSPNWSGHLRTRVTHSLEVAQIGRSIAARLGLPTNLVETCCLAHDLGHPPFGHAGEQALDELLEPFGLRFEGNAQTFRILTLLESQRAGISGLNLTRATLMGCVKYTYTPESRHKKSLYEEDRDSFTWLFDRSPYSLTNDPSVVAPPRSVIAEIMDWADDIAYSVHDIEDALATGFLKRPDLDNRDMHERLFEYVQGRDPLSSITIEEVTSTLTKLSYRMRNNLLFVPRGQTKQVLGTYVNEFVTRCKLHPATTISDTSYGYILTVPNSVRNRCEILKALTMTMVVNDARTIVNRYQAKQMLGQIFDMYMENSTESRKHRSTRGKLLPEGKRPILASLGDDTKKIARFVADHISSMTDAQVQRLHSRVFGNAGTSPYEPLIG